MTNVSRTTRLWPTETTRQNKIFIYLLHPSALLLKFRVLFTYTSRVVCYSANKRWWEWRSDTKRTQTSEKNNAGHHSTEMMDGLCDLEKNELFSREVRRTSVYCASLKKNNLLITYISVRSTTIS